MNLSPLQKQRLNYEPTIPEILQNPHSVFVKKTEPTQSLSDQKELKELFSQTFGQPIALLEKGQLETASKDKPLKVGVVFSGGQASGGHNVITGLFDALQQIHPQSELIGFLKGPSGVVEGKWLSLTKEKLTYYRNQGGFDLIGSGRTKIETDQQLKSSMETMNKLKLHGLVIIGGDDSNTNAAILAEYFLTQNCSTKVIGVPKTIDGDLRNEHIEISFGFDTACKTYAEMIGNIGKDALSAKKYYHFIKLMGRSASHIALECALLTHPNLVLVGEEIEKEKKTLSQLTEEICAVICKRAEEDKNYGIILIPEGIVEFIPEIKTLIQELNDLLAQGEKEEKVCSLLSKESQNCFHSLPEKIQKQLLLDRDPHGNIQVSHIATEELLITLCKEHLKKISFQGKFSPVSHFFGYEGRAGLPSNFDAKYCYALGKTAALLLKEGLTGYMSCVYDLHLPTQSWKAKGIPITMLMNREIRKGKKKPVIKKFLVDLEGNSFLEYKKNQAFWEKEDDYQTPGPIQFFGSEEITDTIPLCIPRK